MIFKHFFGALALFASLHSAAAVPAPESGLAVAETTVPDYAILDIIPVGDLNITLYGIPGEKPNVGPTEINKRCGSNQLNCDPNWKNLAADDNCLTIINSLRDPKFSNNVIPNGLKSTCTSTCCIAISHNLSGTGARWSDLVSSAFAVYSRCPRFEGKWLSGWTADTLLGGQCGNQCLSAASFC